MKLTQIEKAIEDLKNGQMVILTKSGDEGTHGCFVIAPEYSNPEMINKMIFYGRSQISLVMLRNNFKHLNFPLDNEFSIDAATGIKAGLSAVDRNQTIKTACSSSAKSADLVSPGHIYPILAKEGGCLVRPLLADASYDLIRLAELGSVAVICEIINDKGEYALDAELDSMALELGLNTCSISDLVEYRFIHEPLVERINTVDLPTEYGNFRLHVYKARFDSTRGVDLALTFGKNTFDDKDIPLVRVHSEWSIANIVNRLSYEEGSFLNKAMKKVSESESGAIIFLRNTPEQHTNSLFSSAKKPTDIWQEKGRLKTLAPMGDMMSYGFGAQILRDLGVRRMKILSNKKNSFKGIDSYGLEILEQLPF